MSKAQIDAVLNMKPSAYRSMIMGSLGLTKSSPTKKKDLLRWGSANKGEDWQNLTALLTDNQILPCGKKGKKQLELGLKSVCRPKKKVNEKTPEIASSYSTAQIKKAIAIKQKGQRINWKEL